MSKLRCRMAVSLDGYVAGPNQSAEHPLGEGGVRLHAWAFRTRTFRSMHGGADGETGVDDDVLREAWVNVGSTIMGRNMFGPTRGTWGPEPWRGWWGDNPPFHHPVFVLTHQARPPLVMAGGTSFHFVTDGITSALAQARAAAGGRDVMLGGGAHTVRQFFAAGLLDEIDLHVVPFLLGRGERLFDGLDPGLTRLELIRTLSGAGVSHLKFRVLPPDRAP